MHHLPAQYTSLDSGVIRNELSWRGMLTLSRGSDQNHQTQIFNQDKCVVYGT